jgi:predicted N-acetyltransferase YhbS
MNDAAGAGNAIVPKVIVDVAATAAPVSDTAAFPSRSMGRADLADVEALHDTVFGPGALSRTAYRVREGQPPFTPYCRVLHVGGVLAAAIRFTVIRVGDEGGDEGGVLMLGPLAVAAAFANQGHGRRLIGEGLASAKAAGVAAVLLVGDPPYYARFGFQRVPPGQITLPGPVDASRLLLAELVPGAGARLRGMVAGAV